MSRNALADAGSALYFSGVVMRAVVVYESMYGNTHLVAERIGAGLEPAFDVLVTAVEGADPSTVANADLLVVGGPTHAHSMTSKQSRKAAVDAAAKDPELEVDPDAEGPGLRDWFDAMTKSSGTPAAAFDTRIDAAAVLTGRASKGIAKRLRRHGFDVIADPESFLVDKHNHLLEGESDRAHAWAASLGVAADRAKSAR
jgi:hypothetical protein